MGIGQREYIAGAAGTTSPDNRGSATFVRLVEGEVPGWVQEEVNRWLGRIEGAHGYLVGPPQFALSTCGSPQDYQSIVYGCLIVYRAAEEIA